MCKAMALPFANWINSKLETLGLSNTAKAPKKTGQCPTFVLLVAGGSYNPPHIMHVQNFKRANQHSQIQASNEFSVFGGVIVPTSDSYLTGKLGKEWTMKAHHRMAMCQLAIEQCNEEFEAKTEGSLFIQVFPRPEANSSQVLRGIQNEARNLVPSWVAEKKLLVCHMFGADFVVKHKLWNRILPEPLFCIPRKGYTEAVIEGIKNSTVHSESRIIVVNDDKPQEESQSENEQKTQSALSVRNASSTEIRLVLEGGDWSSLEELEILDKKVARYMIEYKDDLFL
eukprot:TRINITY_DN3904_c0_g2_i1.p1 TRINITY_DN3904_c0_g2~~TRINITY_DN3904_c0_g2_i1.p1  ORF type:complete len:291 (+),score=77.58 TRINITY_DN3904_c0_g2_i1:23-874(+)